VKPLWDPAQGMAILRAAGHPIVARVYAPTPQWLESEPDLHTEEELGPPRAHVKPAAPEGRGWGGDVQRHHCAEWKPMGEPM